MFCAILRFLRSMVRESDSPSLARLLKVFSPTPPNVVAANILRVEVALAVKSLRGGGIDFVVVVADRAVLPHGVPGYKDIKNDAGRPGGGYITLAAPRKWINWYTVNLNTLG